MVNDKHIWLQKYIVISLSSKIVLILSITDHGTMLGKLLQIGGDIVMQSVHLDFVSAQ